MNYARVLKRASRLTPIKQFQLAVALLENVKIPVQSKGEMSEVKKGVKQDNYTEEILKEQFNLHKDYVEKRMKTTSCLGKQKIRLPSIPEDITENCVKFILHYKQGDRTSRWNCSTGDLFSEKEGKQECKCFSSDGPTSFTPSSEWDVIYFLDARKWLSNSFALYRINLTKSSTEWKSIKMSSTQTFDDQCKQGRRPRINWKSLYPQIEKYCTKIYEGTFEDIFTPGEVVQDAPQST